jgi:hypothetical protein
MSLPLGRVTIERGERWLVACSAAILFLIGWASVSVTNVSETFFLKRIGVEFLPLVFLANSLLLVGTTWVVGRVAARVEQQRLPRRTFAGLAVALVPLWALVIADVKSVFVLLVIASKQLGAIALLVFWMLLGGMLHGRQAKRLSAPIMAGGTLGAILGSFASGPTGRILGIPALLPVAAVALALASVLSIALLRLAPARLDHARRRPRSAPSHEAGADDKPTLRSLWQESWLFRAVAVSAVLSGLLGPMLYFQFSYVVDLATQGSDAEMRLLGLYAQFRGWINIAVLAVQLVGTSPLFRRIGLPLSSALSPLVYLLGLTGLSVQLSLPTGIGAVAGARLQDHAVYDPAQKTLFTLFSERIRPAATALIDGPAKRAGGVVGNVVILLALAVGSPVWVGYLGLPVAALWLVVAVGLWRAYPTLLLEASSTRRAHAGEALPLEELVDQETIRLLESCLVDPDYGRCRAACELISEAPGERGIDVLMRAARHAPVANRRLLLETLDGLLKDGMEDPTTHPEAARNIQALLAEPGELDQRERAVLIRTFGRLAGRLRPGSPGAKLLERCVHDPAPAVRLAALASLHHTGAERHPARDLDDAIRTVIDGGDTAARQVACEELRASLIGTQADGEPREENGLHWHDRLALLSSLLTLPAERPGAADALADIARHHGARAASAAPALLALAADPDARVRAAVVRFVGCARLEKEARWLVERLTSEDDVEALAAADALRALGPAVSDVLLEALHLGKRSTRNALLPILREMPVDRQTLRELIDAEIATITRVLALRRALATGAVSEIVLQRLGERADEAIHTTLLLLAALQQEERIAGFCRLLGRARDRRDRAVLHEALEALLPPEHRSRLMALLEERSRGGLPEASLPMPALSFEQAVGEVLGDEDRLTSVLLEATLDPATLVRVGASPSAGGESGVDTGPPHGLTPLDHMPSTIEIILHLRSLAIFEGLSTRQLADLAGIVREETHPAGATIVREGEFDDCMYLIVDGTIHITREGQQLAELGPRDFFGEMAVLDAEQRSATATAASRVRLLRLDRHDLFVVMDEQPAIAITICQTLTRRVRELNDRVQALHVLRRKVPMA